MSDKLDPAHGDRLNLPFTGIATFAKVPYHPNLDTLDADVAIVGAPYDMGTQVRRPLWPPRHSKCVRDLWDAERHLL
jgi:hypothetical protein